MPGIFTLSSTAASNTSIDGVSVAENCAAGNLNNGLRSLAALVRSSFASALENFLAGTAALPVANGGTGATTASAARTALAALGSEFQDLPISTQTGAFNIVASMKGGAINYTGAAAACTIQPNATESMGTSNVAAIVIRNNGSGSLTITRGSGVSLKKNYATTSADATLPVGAECVLKRWGADDWTVIGGVS